MGIQPNGLKGVDNLDPKFKNPRMIPFRLAKNRSADHRGFQQTSTLNFTEKHRASRWKFERTGGNSMEKNYEKPSGVFRETGQRPVQPMRPRAYETRKRRHLFRKMKTYLFRCLQRRTQRPVGWFSLWLAQFYLAARITRPTYLLPYYTSCSRKFPGGWVTHRLARAKEKARARLSEKLP